MIFKAAAELFRRRGYRGTRLEDIGAAVGMTGPAIYRHFPNKEALLAELLQRAVDRAQRDLESALGAGLGPRPTLERVVGGAVVHALEESDLVAMAEREVSNLTAARRARIARQRRAILDGWVVALRAVRPELDATSALALVVGAAGLVTSSALHGPRRTERARDLYARAALAALLSR
jgi:AcrR family transcriptional regulator